MKRNLQFLSKSVLLEEKGLPGINRLVIISTFAILILFIIWANSMVINDTISITGKIVRDGSPEGFYIKGQVPSSDVGELFEGMDAHVSISGITDRKKIDATLKKIVRVPQYDKQSRTFYEVRLTPVLSEKSQIYLRSVLIRGMDTHVEVVTGTRNLLQYYFSKLWDARSKSGF